MDDDAVWNLFSSCCGLKVASVLGVHRCFHDGRRFSSRGAVIILSYLLIRLVVVGYGCGRLSKTAWIFSAGLPDVGIWVQPPAASAE